MQVEIRDAPFDPWQEVAARQEAVFRETGRFGATSVFVGTMRDFNEGDPVASMILEHYAGMTERHLESICVRAAEQWEVLEILVIHRVGKLYPGEPIVLVAVWSAHRAAAYQANRFIMEDLKSVAPFWKKEELGDSSRWVERNTPA